MDIPRFSPLNDDNAPFDSKEFEAGYLAPSVNDNLSPRRDAGELAGLTPMLA